MVLKDRVAVITGTASGIGQATAILFAREGATVICIDEKPSQQTLALIQDQNGHAIEFQADVSNSAKIRAVVKECEKRLDKIDILFNNAGQVVRQSFEATTEEMWAKMVGINLTGQFICSKYFLPLIKKSDAGSIINHASIDAFLGNPASAAYSAAKGGVIPLTHVMAHDLGKYNIRVNCLSSGGISVSRSANATTSDGIARQSRIDVTPLQRLGSTEEVAHAALFLASAWSSFVNGANLVVDGGRTVITQGTYHGYD